jgi:hypothetical protein
MLTRRISVINFKALAEGTLSLLPGTAWLFSRGTLGTGSARYCYAVWLRHLIRTAPFRQEPLAGLVVELGPGDSLGIGLAALLCGATRYIAVDVVRHANVERNLAVLSELAQLFAARSAIPTGDEFPEIKPRLDNHAFPEALLPPEAMRAHLAPARIEAIAAALRGTVGDDAPVRYVDPASGSRIPPGSASMVFSQAVLEHVDDLEGVYGACHAWLAPTGIMSHQIDLKSHGTALEWNGHWVYPDALWALLRGRRSYLLNREPCGGHLERMARASFEVLTAERYCLPSRLERQQLAARFRTMVEEDLGTAGVFVVARNAPQPAGGT